MWIIFIQLLSLIKHHQEMQEKQYPLVVQQTSNLSILVQVQQDIQKQLAVLHMSVLHETLSQLRALVQIHREVKRQLMNITDILKPPQDCSTAPTTGPIKILPPNKALGAFTVYCGMGITPVGWLIFQRRFDGSLDFDRNWIE